MEDDPESEFKKVLAPGEHAVKITKWKVRKGTNVSRGVVLALYDALKPESVQKNLKLKSSDGGIVHKIEVAEGEEVNPGSLLLTIGTSMEEPCSHPTVMKDMCAVCGEDLRSEMGMAGDRKETVTASVAMVHSIPELIVSEQQALELGLEDENRLLKTRKLVLLVDLDQTLIHTTNDNIPPKLKDVSHFQLWHGPNLLWYHTKFRPYTKGFLEKVSRMYELHICTFGVRMYAHTIARLLDPDEKFFSHRILSRDECFNAMSKTANLKALFPCGDSMVCIIDDREDVWNFSPNLIHVKPYRFFQGTADINAPPGLTKTENDNIPVTHRVRRTSDSQDEKKTGHKTLESCDKSEEVKMEDDTKQEKASAEEIHVNGTDSPEKSATDSMSGPSDTNLKHHVNLSDNETVQTKEMFSEDSKPVHPENKGVKDSSADGEKNCPGNEATPSAKTEKTVEEGCKNAEDKATPETKETFPVESVRECTESSDVKEGEDDEEIEWEDDDDYLYHLEEILTRIHKAFYDLYDQTKSKESTKLPNVKDIIPYVKRKVLKGCNIVFSGVVPLNMQPEKSRAHVVARSLGANIQTSLVPRKGDNKAEATTHLVAAKPGTAKVNSALKMKSVSIVNTSWLWSCAERWDRVEELLFPLDDPSTSAAKTGPLSSHDKQAATSNSSINKRKSDEMMVDSEPSETVDSVTKKSKKAKLKSEDSDDVFSEGPADGAVAGPSGSQGSKNNENTPFASSYNPLYSFSDADIEFMDKEVDELMEEESDSEEEDEEDRNERIRQSVLGDVSDSSSEESLAGDFPRGWNIRKRSPSGNSDEDRMKKPAEVDESDNEMEDYEKTVQAFSAENSQSSDSGDSIGSVDDAIADAVEKEFLSLL